MSDETSEVNTKCNKYIVKAVFYKRSKNNTMRAYQCVLLMTRRDYSC